MSSTNYRGPPQPRPRGSSTNNRGTSNSDHNFNYRQSTADAGNYDRYYQSAAQLPPNRGPTYNYPGSRQHLEVNRQPLRDSAVSDLDSVSSARPYSMSSASRDADLESVASGQTRSSVISSSDISLFDSPHYRGEQYRPIAAPRKINNQVRTLFGEKHPRLLKPEELPTFDSSADETEVSSVSSYNPVPRPRTSSMRSKHTAVTFIEEDAIRRENASLRTILIWDISAYNKPKRIVRFEYVDKRPVGTLRDKVDYSDIDSGESKVSKDIWKNVKPISSGGRDRSSGRRSKAAGRSRSRSSDRKRTGSLTSNSSRSSHGRQSRSQGRPRAQSNAQPHQPPAQSHQTVSHKVSAGDVVVKKSVMADINGQKCCADKQKACKWGLIIGIPVVLIVIAVAVVGAVYASGGG